MTESIFHTRIIKTNYLIVSFRCFFNAHIYSNWRFCTSTSHFFIVRFIYLQKLCCMRCAISHVSCPTVYCELNCRNLQERKVSSLFAFVVALEWVTFRFVRVFLIIHTTITPVEYRTIIILLQLFWLTLSKGFRFRRLDTNVSPDEVMWNFIRKIKRENGGCTLSVNRNYLCIFLAGKLCFIW